MGNWISKVDYILCGQLERGVMNYGCDRDKVASGAIGKIDGANSACLVGV